MALEQIPTELAREQRGPEAFSVELRINGALHRLEVEPRVTLLDALRERLRLTGAKKVCDHGQCGACTVLVNGRRINSCLTLAVMHEGDEITMLDGFDDKANPFGVKGVGEIGLCGSSAAVANAVFNATGVRVRDFPITLEKVFMGDDRTSDRT